MGHTTKLISAISAVIFPLNREPQLRLAYGSKDGCAIVQLIDLPVKAA